MHTLRYAFRNLLRNGRRTAVTAVAVVAASGLLVVAIALMDGLRAGTVHNATAIVAGEVEIHALGYRASPRIDRTVSASREILTAARRSGLDATVRAYGDGLLALDARSVGARFWGVDAEAERRAFELPRDVTSGTFLDGPRDDHAAPVVLGARIARSLHAEVGSELAGIVQGSQGSMGSGLLRVVGILRAVSSEIDLSAAIMRQADFDALFGTRSPVHEIALTSHGHLAGEAVAAAVRDPARDAEVLTWRQLSPGLAEMLGLFDGFTWMTVVVFVASAALGVTNTMLMATFERFHEFGVTLALGGTPGRIVLDVAAEAFLLGGLASATGVVAGMGAAAWLQFHGIDLGGKDLVLSGLAFDSVWRARLSVGAVALPGLAMCLTCVAAALYPAAKAARLDPVAAMASH